MNAVTANRKPPTERRWDPTTFGARLRRLRKVSAAELAKDPEGQEALREGQEAMRELREDPGRVIIEPHPYPYRL